MWEGENHMCENGDGTELPLSITLQTQGLVCLVTHTERARHEAFRGDPGDFLWGIDTGS